VPGGSGDRLSCRPSAAGAHHLRRCDQDWHARLLQCLSAVLLGTLTYRSGLVPRALPLTGLIGAPLLLASSVAVFFGVIEPISPWTAVATLPVALWEFSLDLWLTFKGLRPTPITAGMTTTAASSPDRDVAAVWLSCLPARLDQRRPLCPTTARRFRSSPGRPTLPASKAGWNRGCPAL